MSIASKSLLSACTALVLAGLSLAPAAADDASRLPVTGALLDHIENQIDGLKDKLTVHRDDDSNEHLAQGYGYGRPPGEVGGGDSYGGGGGADDAAGLEVRVSRIEEQMRQLNGQIEQMQFAQRKLDEQLRKFQQDVDFRFQDAGHGGGAPAPRPAPQKRSDADGMIDDQPKPVVAQAQTTQSDGAPMNLRSSHRGDAFDPASDPNAPGAPKPLGSIASGSTALPPPSAPKAQIAEAETDPNAPLDLSSGRRPSMGASATTPSATTPPGFGTQSAPRQIPLTQAPSTDINNGPSTQMAAVPPIASPREEFDSALASFKQKEYETAEKGFSTFLQKNPKNPRTPDAIYYLGESYFNRGRQREAAEQYLKISTDYSASARAPEALLRLGMSLKALGAKEQACASFNQITAKYPNASAWVKTGAERESKRSQC